MDPVGPDRQRVGGVAAQEREAAEGGRGLWGGPPHLASLGGGQECRRDEPWQHTGGAGRGSGMARQVAVTLASQGPVCLLPCYVL